VKGNIYIIIGIENFIEISLYECKARSYTEK